MASNELQVLSVDQELRQAIERGEVTQSEVDNIWHATADLTAQTPINVRRAVILMRKQGTLADAWPVYFTEMMRMMANTEGAITRDESKFAHLVAGTEAIVKTLQNLNPLNQRLERTDHRIARLESMMELINDKLDRLLTGSLVIKPTPSVGTVEETPLPEGTRRAEDVNPDDEEGRASQVRKDSIGSAWAK